MFVFDYLSKSLSNHSCNCFLLRIIYLQHFGNIIQRIRKQAGQCLLASNKLFCEQS